MIITVDITIIIALWGAFTGTMAIIWDFFKWWTDGPRLQVTVDSNMQVANPINGRLDEEKHIMIRVVNVGRRAIKSNPPCRVALQDKTPSLTRETK